MEYTNLLFFYLNEKYKTNIAETIIKSFLQAPVEEYKLCTITDVYIYLSTKNF